MNAENGEPVAAIDLSRFRRIRPREIAIRFAFGAAISVVIGLVSLEFGPKAAGMFLAFPAVLPASVTLIERKEGTREASHNVEGAVFGGLAAIAFALTAHTLLTRVYAPAALVLAFAAWASVALSSYLLYETIQRSRHRPHGQARRGNGREQGSTDPRDGVALG